MYMYSIFLHLPNPHLHLLKTHLYSWHTQTYSGLIHTYSRPIHTYSEPIYTYSDTSTFTQSPSTLTQSTSTRNQATYTPTQGPYIRTQNTYRGTSIPTQYKTHMNVHLFRAYIYMSAVPTSSHLINYIYTIVTLVSKWEGDHSQTHSWFNSGSGCSGLTLNI